MFASVLRKVKGDVCSVTRLLGLKTFVPDRVNTSPLGDDRMMRLCMGRFG